jgi:hypothetical protein
VLVWLSLARSVLSPYWLTAPVVLFTSVAIYHEIVIRRIARAHRAIRYYERGLDRLNNNWAGRGQGGERFHDPSHPYAEDLDVFGKGSLFELLNTARLRSGEETLAQWLLKPAPPGEVRSRQDAVQELRLRLDFREDLANLGEDAGPGVHNQELAAWGEAPALFDSRRPRAIAAVLAATTVAAAIVWSVWDFRPPFLAAVLIQSIFALSLRPRVLAAVRAVEHPAHDLSLFAHVLVRLEREEFTSAKLRALRAALDTGGLPASHHIARLNRIVDLIDSRDNVAVRLIGPFLLWTTQSALALEAWRSACGPSLRRWLEAAGEIEALSALGNYAYEHPGDPFPEFEEGPAHYSASGISHPLLPPSRAVPNDVRLGPECRVLIVSGSNMSGKSTLLRTIGVNAVLAMAGAPVRAQKLSLSPVAVGASIRVMDSLQSGSSRFYAEITRLRLLADIAAGPLPLLFLLDELLHGTNSHDRKIGAEAIVKGLVKRGAIGLITTHDLALAHIADVLQPHGFNVHFEDQLTEGRISFDYVLRPGIVRKSNALELMRYVGLEV